MDEIDDTDMTPAQFREASARGVPTRIVTSKAAFDEQVALGLTEIDEQERTARAKRKQSRGAVTTGSVPWHDLDGTRAEKFISILLLREFPDGVRRRPSQGDDGIDVVVPVSDNPRQYDVYQIKSYYQTLKSDQRAKIRGSIERFLDGVGRSGLEVRGWHLAVPLDATAEDEEWIKRLFDGTGINAYWKGWSFLEGLAAKYRDVVDYYIRGDQDRLAGLVENALSLAGLRSGAGDSGLDADSAYRAASTVLERLNSNDPHYYYGLSINYDDPDFSSAPSGAVMSYFSGVASGPTMRIDVYPRYGLATVDRPISASLTIRVPEAMQDLRASVERFNLYGDDLNVPAGYASMTTDDPLFGSETTESVEVRLSSIPPEPRRLRFIVAEETGERVATAFFNVLSVSQGLSGRGAVVRFRSDTGLIALENWLETDDGEIYRGRFNFSLNWRDKIASQILSELEFGNAIVKPRKLVLAQEFSGPFTDIAKLDEIVSPAIPNWLVSYARALSALQDYADVPLRVVGPDDVDDPGVVENAIHVAGLLRGNALQQTAPQMLIKMEGVESAEVVEAVNTLGALRMRTPFHARVANGLVSIPAVFFEAGDVKAELLTHESEDYVVIKPVDDSNPVVLTARLMDDEESQS